MSATTNPALGTLLSAKIPEEAKRSIINRIWGSTFNRPTYTAYLAYYEAECIQHTTVGIGSDRFPFSQHVEVLDAIDIIFSARDKPGDELRQLLAQRFPKFQTVSSIDQNQAITLCLRLWLMINYRDSTDGHLVAGAGKVSWDGKDSVLSLIRTALVQAITLPPGSSTTTLNHDFNALKLKRLTGVNIIFTANLADHLVYDPEIRQLLVFHHNAFLNAHLQPLNGFQLCSGVFDVAFLRETQQTLSLLFPSHDPASKRHLDKLRKDNAIDDSLGNIARAGSTPSSLDEFKYYRSRLETLNAVLITATPTGAWQLWFDRRNKQAWVTLWIAVVVLFLTAVTAVISSVTSIMQVT